MYSYQGNFNKYGNDPQGNNQNNFDSNFNTFNKVTSNSNLNNYGGFQIPDQFNMKQKLMTFGMDLCLQKNGTQFGYIKQKLITIGRTFQLQDQSGGIVAVAKQIILTIGRDFEIYDNNNNKIGTIVQQVLKSMFSSFIKYTIKDANGIVVGTSKELDFFKSSIQVINVSTNQVEASFEEDLIHIIRHNWTINFLGSNIDRRLLIFFPVITSQRQSQKTSQGNND